METGSFDRLIAKSRIIQGCKHGRAILHNYGVRTVSPWSDLGMQEYGTTDCRIVDTVDTVCVCHHGVYTQSRTHKHGAFFLPQLVIKGSPYSITQRRADPGSWQSACR